MNTQFASKSTKISATFTLIALLIPSIAFAGFLSSTFQQTIVNGYRYVAIVDAGVTGGISHDLDPNDWFKFRVRIRHEDAQFPLIGFTSDNFDPTSDNIQICNVEGCEAPQINAGVEELDWTDMDKVSVYLEAKECLLCEWQGFSCDFE